MSLIVKGEPLYTVEEEVGTLLLVVYLTTALGDSGVRMRRVVLPLKSPPGLSNWSSSPGGFGN